MDKTNSDRLKNYSKKKYSNTFKKIKYFTLFVLLISSFIYFINAPFFKIKSINIIGINNISDEIIEEKVSSLVGENIFLYNREDLRKNMDSLPYIKGYKVKLKNINTIDVIIEEETPIYFITSDADYLIVNDDLKIIDITSTLPENLVEIRGLSFTAKSIGEVLDVESVNTTFLEKIHPYIEAKVNDITFNFLDLTNIVDVKGKIGDIDIYLGDDSNLKYKMETIYSIILSDEVSISKGTINVSFEGSPVIKKES